MPKRLESRKSYWREVENNWFDLTPMETEEKSIWIDSYWTRVLDMKDENDTSVPTINTICESFLTLVLWKCWTRARFFHQ